MSPCPRRASRATLLVLAIAIATTAPSDVRASRTAPPERTPTAGEIWDQLEQTWTAVRRSWASWLDFHLGDEILDVIALATDLHELSARLAGLSVLPVDAPATSEFGYRRDPINRRRRLHKGIDFDAERGAPVRAAGYGRVVQAGRRGGYGRLVVVDHGFGLETRYAHLRRIKVAKGDIVEPGTLVGLVGQSGRATGPHLHFEVRRSGEAVDPRDEMPIP